MIQTLMAATLFFNGVAVQEVEIPKQVENGFETFERVTGHEVPKFRYTKEDNVIVSVKNGVLHFDSKEPEVIYKTKEVIKYVERDEPETPSQPTVDEPKNEPKQEVTPQPKQEAGQPKTPSTGEQLAGKFTFTYYTANCKGCTGITATGIDVRNNATYNGMRIIAVNPNVIPYWSIVQVTLDNGHTFKAIALDTGGKMRQSPNYIDVLVNNEAEAYTNGVDTGTIEILRKGRSVTM